VLVTARAGAPAGGLPTTATDENLRGRGPVRRAVSLATFAAVVLIASSVGIAATASSAPSPRPANRVLPVLPVNHNYAAIKSRIDAHAPGQSAAAAAVPGPLAPTIGASFRGLGATAFSPADTRGAIGPTEYVETVNTNVAVFTRAGVQMSANAQQTWTGDPNALGDADVIYSPHDGRFYATLLSIPIDPVTLNPKPPFDLIVGFSKTNAPTASPSDWCFYTSDFNGRYGANLPDYPKLGQTADFMLMGVNVFANGPANFTYIGSDVAWVSKPPVGDIATCPGISSFKLGTQNALKNADGSLASTPVGANQTDGSGTGFVVANKDPGAGTSTVLSLYRVTRNATTGAAQFSAPKNVTVPAYAYPPSAPQPGTRDRVDTLDARLTNAVVSPDPRFRNKVEIWTQHAVAASAGGLGSEERWYEISGRGSLKQMGKAQSPDLYAFMGAISPDRNGTLGKFGSNMVLGFNTSSSTTAPQAQMVSKIGASPQSGFVLIHTSDASDTDFSCDPAHNTACRWGDYSGASPDPASSGTATSGKVWVALMLSGPTDPTGFRNPTWFTWIAETSP
jgi:hypothetical protein